MALCPASHGAPCAQGPSRWALRAVWLHGCWPVGGPQVSLLAACGEQSCCGVCVGTCWRPSFLIWTWTPPLPALTSRHLPLTLGFLPLSATGAPLAPQLQYPRASEQPVLPWASCRSLCHSLHPVSSAASLPPHTPYAPIPPSQAGSPGPCASACAHPQTRRGPRTTAS